jgi:hypothetical protein
MMSKVLQGALLVAGVLALTVVAIVAWQLIGAVRGKKQHGFPWIMVLEGSIMFSGSLYAMAIVLGRLGDQFAQRRTLEYGILFGLAAGALAYFGRATEGKTPQGQATKEEAPEGKRPLSRVLHFLSWALPIGSGLIGGAVGLGPV